MSELGDGAKIKGQERFSDGCPVCEGSHTFEALEKSADLESDPDKLGCDPLEDLVPGCTTAKHHLIPARQSLPAFPRLSQICEADGYDVNNPKNGMPLPTSTFKDPVAKKNRATLPNDAMYKTKRQWHSSHHQWDTKGAVASLEGDPQTKEIANDVVKHICNYDTLVRVQLRRIEREVIQKGLKDCPLAPHSKASAISARLNELSDKIQKMILGWSTFFVSKIAYLYAVENKERTNMNWDASFEPEPESGSHPK